MGLYNFQKRFVSFIQRGEKTHTIRAVRKHPAKPGETLYLYTGLRTKKAKKLMETECVKVEEINIWPIVRCFGELRTVGISIDGQELSDDECEQLARRDGFKSFAEMMEFWDGRLPFKGHIIYWSE